LELKPYEAHREMLARAQVIFALSTRRAVPHWSPARYTRAVPTVPSFEIKICAPADVVARAGEMRRPLVFTNGVFDILHRGHASYLAQARALGASLLVALNSDASVQRLGKGPDRPINTLDDRLALVAALESVGLVTWFDDDTPLALIEAVRPDALVKGGDWAANDIVGATEVKSWNGTVHSIPFIHARSTTATLKKIRSQ
jgi:rfaE bifunctional protein nucleotidyltransferase chain/domain